MIVRGNRDLGATPPNSSLISTGINVAGGGLIALAPILGLTAAIPVVGPIIAGVSLLVAALGIGNGCGSSCTEATTIANNAETAFGQNLAAAQQTIAANGCLTSAEQTQLVANYWTIYNNMIAGCQQLPAPGGPACVSAREPGGQYASAPNYLVPIQNMPVCNPVQTLSADLGGISPVVLIGVGLLGLLLLSD